MRYLADEGVSSVKWYGVSFQVPEIADQSRPDFLFRRPGKLHLNIDFLSTDQSIFRKIIQAHFAGSFVVKEYRGNN